MSYDFEKASRRIDNVLNGELSIRTGVVRKEGEMDFKHAEKGYIAAIAVDIVGYKRMCDINNEKTVIKIMQSFVHEVLAVGKNTLGDSYRSFSLAGDQVILIAECSMKETVEKVLNTTYYLNSLGNMLSKKAGKKGINFSYGIGAAVSENNYAYLYGIYGSESRNEVAVIGDSIPLACTLSEAANRNGFNKIIIDSMLFDNVPERIKADVSNWFKRCTIKSSIWAYQADVFFRNFEEFVNNVA